MQNRSRNFEILLILFADRKYSVRFWLEFAIPFIPPSTFNARFSCSLPRSVPIDINSTSYFAMQKLPSSLLCHIPDFFVIFSHFKHLGEIEKHQLWIIHHIECNEIQHNCWRLYKTELLWRASYKCDKTYIKIFKGLSKASCKAVNWMNCIKSSRNLWLCLTWSFFFFNEVKHIRDSIYDGFLQFLLNLLIQLAESRIKWEVGFQCSIHMSVVLNLTNSS